MHHALVVGKEVAGVPAASCPCVWRGEAVAGGREARLQHHGLVVGVQVLEVGFVLRDAQPAHIRRVVARLERDVRA